MIRGTHRFAALAALTLALVAGRADAQTQPKPYFSPNGGGAEATAALIDNARSTIDVAMYSVSSGPSNPIWGAMQRAVARGVRVRFILDQATGSNKSKADALAGIGVHVYGVRKTLHEKFALFDAATTRRKLVNGSANWSLGAMTRYSENTTVFGSHIHLVHAFQQEFNRLLVLSRPISPGADAHMAPGASTTPSPYTRRYEQVLFTTTNTAGTTVAGSKIIEVMRAAQRSVLIDVAHFNSRSIADAVIELRRDRPDLRIEVLVDLGSYADTKSRCRDLERAGVAVRYKTYSLVWLHPRSQLMHHKTMIVDETRLVTGSFNWSDTAELSNHENIVVIEGNVSKNRACVAAFVAEHNKLWGLNRAVYPRFRAAMLAQPGSAAYKPILPVHFDTPYFNTVMTLTRDEIAPVRAVGFSSGILERMPDGTTKKNNDATYLDRVAAKPYRGPAPQGNFLDSNTGGLTGSVPPGQ